MVAWIGLSCTALARGLHVTPVLATIVLGVLFAPSLADCQTITSSGLGTRVTTSGTTTTIEGGRRAGTNLFHSFGTFSVNTGHTARFRNTGGVTTDNIVGRVTGGSPSRISGTIDTLSYPNADLW